MSKSLLRSCTTVLALTLAGAGLAAHAAAPAETAKPAATSTAAPGSPAATHHHHGGWKKGHGRHMRGERPAAWVPGLGPLPQSVLDKLDLDAGQQAKVEQARQQQREWFGKMRQARQDQRKLFASQVQADKLDPHALLAQRQEITQFVKARHAAMAERRQRRSAGPAAS